MPEFQFCFDDEYGIGTFYDADIDGRLSNMAQFEPAKLTAEVMRRADLLDQSAKTRPATIDEIGARLRRFLTQEIEITIDDEHYMGRVVEIFPHHACLRMQTVDALVDLRIECFLEEPQLPN